MENFWIMKNIFRKIEFHYTFLIIALGLVLTGHFSNLIVFTSLIIIHEFGHTITALLFKYKIKKIIIYPYGGLTKLETIVNTNINKDLLVVTSGVIIQSLFFLLIYLLYIDGIVREYVYNLYLLYHKSMLIFNLLPIIPLDGFKIVNLILSKYLNFNLTNNISVVISLLGLVIFIFSGLYEKNYSIIIIIGILMNNIYKFYEQIAFICNRFLLERYLYNFTYKNKVIIKNYNKMYKNKSHFFFHNGKIITEKNFLTYIFGKK